jgi:hypothetical protein
MSDLYLIAHKVRGEAAFDIAQRLPELDKDGEEAWIIPTSGHRAFPFWTFELRKIMYLDEVVWNTEVTMDAVLRKLCPPNWPDHYSVNDRAHYRAIEEMSDEATNPEVDVLQGQSLAERLGIKRPPAPTITRRL